MNADSQILPQSIESEMSVLGAIFVDSSVMDEVLAIVGAEDFYRESHRKIFQAMAAMADRNEPIDGTTLLAEMIQRKCLEEVGGASYLYVLADYVPHAANVAHYCRIVAQKAADRRFIRNTADALQMAYKDGATDEAIARLESAIQPAADKHNSAPVGMDQSLKEMSERIKHRMSSKDELQGLSYGIEELDKATSGMHPGELIIIAGRPSMGKSALAGNILSSVCKSGKPGMMFTLEMGRGDIIDRLAAAHNIKYQNIRSGRLEELEQMKILKAIKTMQQWPLFIDDTPGISLREVRAKARRQKKDGLSLVVIDYLQLMSMSDPKANRVQGIGEISRGLKQLARELELPIILLSQLNRGVDGRPDKRPMMSDLRDSGEIEQDADVIIFPYRSAAYCQQCRDKVDDGSHDFKEHQSKAEIIIEKQRAGERNLSIPVCWVGQYQRFDGLEDCPW